MVVGWNPDKARPGIPVLCAGVKSGEADTLSPQPIIDHKSQLKSSIVAAYSVAVGAARLAIEQKFKARSNDIEPPLQCHSRPRT